VSDVAVANITIDVPGDVVPWARAGRGKGYTFTPEPQRLYGAKIGWYAKAAMVEARRGDRLYGGAMRLDVVAKFTLPKSAPKRNPPKHKTTKPDADNIVKIVKDALNGIVWADDAQVVQMNVSKVYAPAPGLTVNITALEAA
jgi:Holliday junction resolvase RusA-like endonuclease